jgi:hypothetical protein
MFKKNIWIILLILLLLCIFYTKITKHKPENNYFSNNFDIIYRSIDFEEKKILDNTFIKIDSYVNDYWMLEYWIQKQLFKYYDKKLLSDDERLIFNKLFYLSLRDIHDLKLLIYDKNKKIDNDIYIILESIINE